MSADRLTYRDEDHTYWLDGVRIPSVTQVLSLAGLGVPDDVPRDILAKAAAKGSFIHKACELLDEGDLDETSVPEEWRGYVQAWARFKEERVARILSVEEMVHSNPDHQPYAGKLDRTVHLHGDDGIRTIVDLKTGSRLQPVTRLQLAGYNLCKGWDCKRAAVLLKPDGLYQFQSYDDGDADNQAWCSAVEIAYWRIANDPKVRREYEGKGRKAA